LQDLSTSFHPFKFFVLSPEFWLLSSGFCLPSGTAKQKSEQKLPKLTVDKGQAVILASV
jgi:hypothetical protein